MDEPRKKGPLSDVAQRQIAGARGPNSPSKTNPSHRKTGAPANSSHGAEARIEGGKLKRRVGTSIEASILTVQRLHSSTQALATLTKAAEICIAALRRGNKLFLFGNGGSAADAQHIAAELVGRFAFERPALPALALSVNASCITAIGNDYGFERVFARQIEALARSGDVAIGISTSGNSPNVVQGLATAKKLGLHTIALTGASGGKLKGAAKYCICAPSDQTPRIQECHILIGHVLAELIEHELFNDQGRVSGS
jgi:D-sedoheptulose 7-phosphate isomerase